ncbi:MAG: COX15/CtaA family protein [Cyclobacteriaceae bacterium]|nr:COX15/CtaA family protein [Cyclobacteriaceae bacterium]
MSKTRRSFYRLSLTTLIAVYVLIAVGGIVRTTGSGMGCPDWPKCFGRWIPPTDVSQLPEDYKAHYSEYRHEKNVRFARYLSALGFEETAQQLITDETVREETEFNATKTWIEYFNRLTGATIGILVFAVAVASWRFRKTEPRITIVAVVNLLLVGFQGWIGSVVVSSNLTPWTITVHMFLALLIIWLLVYLVSRSRETSKILSAPLAKGLVLACLGVLIIQVLMGTKVREVVDQLAVRLDRSEWIANIGADFVIHRSFSWVVMILMGALVVRLWLTQANRSFAAMLGLLVLASILSGAAMAYWNVPAALQPLHLVLASVTFGTLVMLLMETNKFTKEGTLKR